MLSNSVSAQQSFTQSFTQRLIDSIIAGDLSNRIISQDSNDWSFQCLCGGTALKVHKKTGAYRNFCCEGTYSNQEIRDFLLPPSDEWINHRRLAKGAGSSEKRIGAGKRNRSGKKGNPLILIPVPEFELFKLPESFLKENKVGKFEFTSHKGPAIVSQYPYGPNSRIDRIDYQDYQDAPKKSDRRSFKFYHRAVEGEVRFNRKKEIQESVKAGTWTEGAGKDPLPAYRIDEVIRAVEQLRLVPGNEQKVYAVLIHEGEKSVEACRNQTLIPSITWGGNGWKEEKLEETAKQFNQAGLVGLFMPDCDATSLGKARTVKSVFAKEGVWVGILNPFSFEVPLAEKDDIVQIIERLKEVTNENQFNEVFEKLFEGAVLAAVNQEVVQASQPPQAPAAQAPAQNAGQAREVADPDQPVPFRPPGARQMAHLIAEGGCNFRWELAKERWWQYEPSGRNKGLWSLVYPDRVKAWVRDRIFELQGNSSLKTLNDTVAFLKLEIQVDEVIDNFDLIPFADKAFNIATGEPINHCPGNFTTWKHPYSYVSGELKTREQLIRECQPIWDWMLESVGGEEYVNILVAFLGATLRRMTNLQRYLECIGPSRSGKGTFLNLAEAIVGYQRSTSTTLRSIEEARFEVAKIVNAQLVKVTDAEHWVKDCSMLKKLTGQDRVAPEEKFVQDKVGQTKAARGLFIVAGEQSPITSDSGGLANRRLTVQFKKPIDETKRRDLIYFEGNELRGEFVPYLPQFIALVLSYSEEEIRRYVLETNTTITSINKIKAETLLDADHISQFLDQCCWWDESGEIKTRIGASINPEDEADNLLRLYPLYQRFCDLSGIHKRLVIQNFSNTILRKMRDHLGLPIEKGLDQDGSFFKGLGIRKKGWKKKPFIISDLYANNYKPKPKEPVIDKTSRSAVEQLLEELSEESSEKEVGATQLAIASESNSTIAGEFNGGNCEPPKAETLTYENTCGNGDTSSVSKKIVSPIQKEDITPSSPMTSPSISEGSVGQTSSFLQTFSCKGVSADEEAWTSSDLAEQLEEDSWMETKDLEAVDSQGQTLIKGDRVLVNANAVWISHGSTPLPKGQGRESYKLHRSIEAEGVVSLERIDAVFPAVFKDFQHEMVVLAISRDQKRVRLLSEKTGRVAVFESCHISFFRRDN
jgi:phage/plasmid-associated DNA primase